MCLDGFYENIPARYLRCKPILMDYKEKVRFNIFIFEIDEGVEKMVELDQIKYELSDMAENLKELGDSL